MPHRRASGEKFSLEYRWPCCMHPKPQGSSPTPRCKSAAAMDLPATCRLSATYATRGSCAFMKAPPRFSARSLRAPCWPETCRCIDRYSKCLPGGDLCTKPVPRRAKQCAAGLGGWGDNSGCHGRKNLYILVLERSQKMAAIKARQDRNWLFFDSCVITFRR